MPLADALTTGADLALPQRTTAAPVTTTNEGAKSNVPSKAPSAGREGVVAFWTSKGAPEHVAQAIADSVQRESGFKPGAWNPDDKGSPSGGQYQHHAERLAGLQGAALAAGVDWRDPNFQHEYAYKEVTGKDPIAAAHWREILAAPDRATAQILWDKYFERGAVVGGGAGGGDGTRRMVGRMGGMGPGVPAAAAAGAKPAEAPDEFTDDERKEIDRIKLRMARLAANAAPPEHEPQPLAAAAPAASPPTGPVKSPKFTATRFQMPAPAVPLPVSLSQAIQIAPGNPLAAALRK